MVIFAFEGIKRLIQFLEILIDVFNFLKFWNFLIYVSKNFVKFPRWFSLHYFPLFCPLWNSTLPSYSRLSKTHKLTQKSSLIIFCFHLKVRGFWWRWHILCIRWKSFENCFPGKYMQAFEWSLMYKYLELLHNIWKNQHGGIYVPARKMRQTWLYKM